MARIGFLDTDVGGATAQPLGAFRDGLKELGLVEGRNLTIEYRFAEGDESRLPTLAAELAALPLSVIVATTTQGTRAAEQTRTAIPIVFTGLQDPVAANLVESLARPGRGATGTTLMTPQLHGKRLELLKKTVPELTRVAVLANPTSVGASMSQVEEAARPLGLVIDPREAHTTSEFEPVFQAMLAAGDQAVMVLPDALFYNNRQQMIALGNQFQLPDMYWAREFADEGALVAYGGNRADAFRRAATYVDKILKGAKAADLPVEQPLQFDFVINTRRATALGLTMPREMLIQATWVVE